MALHTFLRWVSLPLIAAPVLSLAWALGGCRVSALASVMPWAGLAGVVGALLLPQQRGSEGWWNAERRVFKAILVDPLFWILLAMAVYFAIPLFNVALCPVCDWKAIDAGADPYPPCRFLPFCVNRAEHAGLLLVFASAFLGAFGVRHGLTRTGKRAFVELLVWNGVLLVLVGFVQLAAGIRHPLGIESVRVQGSFFSTFGYPNMGGAYFTLMYALSLGLWFCRMGDVEAVTAEIAKVVLVYPHPFLRAHYPVFAVALNLFGIFGTRCQEAIFLSIALSVVFFLYAVLRAFVGTDWGRALRFRHAVSSCGLMLLLFAAIYFYSPPGAERGGDGADGAVAAECAFGKRSSYHTRVAGAIMRDFPFFGVGGWGYRHFAPVYMTPEEVRVRQTQGGANIHNDHLQFLVEHGILGFVLLLVGAVLLALPVMRAWRALAQKARAAERSGFGSPTLVLFAVSPAVLWGMLGCLMVYVHAFEDCPLRSGAVLSAVLSVPSALFGFIPRGENDEDGAY